MAHQPKCRRRPERLTPCKQDERRALELLAFARKVHRAVTESGQDPTGSIQSPQQG